MQDIFDGLVSTGVETRIGRLELSKNAGPPRIVAVPLGAPQILPPDRVGGEFFPSMSQRNRRILVRFFEIMFSCHGTSFETCENLYLDVLRSARKVTHNSVSFGGETWVEQQDDGDGYIKYGNVIEFTATIQIPVFEEDRNLTPIDSFDTTCGFEGLPLTLPFEVN